jgi:imidazolonepropionase-like amidohydrolase
LEGPRILTSIELISPTGGHGDLHDGFREDVRNLLRSPALCDGPARCRQVVRELVARGADVIKFAATGGTLTNIDTGKGVQFFPDEMRAIVETAHMLGRPTAAHAHGTEGVLAALQAGVDSIEHGTSLSDACVELMRKNGTYLVPTLVAAFTVARLAREGAVPAAVVRKAEGHLESRRESVRRAYEAGVRLAFGSDAAVIAHGRNGEEFVQLMEAGVSASDAIASATTGAAAMLGLSGEIGRIKPGMRADIIAVHEDPIADPGRLRDVAFVMRNGVAHKFPPRPPRRNIEVANRGHT